MGWFSALVPGVVFFSKRWPLVKSPQVATPKPLAFKIQDLRVVVSGFDPISKWVRKERCGDQVILCSLFLLPNGVFVCFLKATDK